VPYFAAEGFLPGFNFPRLPVRTFIPSKEGGNFISRPKVVAIRELAPRNILYYEGNKYQITKTKISVQGIEADYQKVAICCQCGYFHEGENSHGIDLCQNCGHKLETSPNGITSKLNSLLAINTMYCSRRERITCDEEERLKYGYNVNTYYRFSQQQRQNAQVMNENNQILLNLAYGDTARIWRVNEGLKSSQEKGFSINRTTGEWVATSGDTINSDSDNTHREVYLTVADTSNILIVEPQNLPEQDAEEFLVTLQHTLARAIQAVYKLEEDELASERMGNGRSILFWESAEGGAGVLSQILDNPHSFQAIAQSALEICHFVTDKPSCSQACYECLLSYRNQFDHPLLNRHAVHDYLNQLTSSHLQSVDSEDRQQQFDILMLKTDPASELERTFLNLAKEAGLSLPDEAQFYIEDANCKPDFLYKKKKIAVFCDGSVHDSPEQQIKDKTIRSNLTFLGYSVFIFRYDDDHQAKLKQLKAQLH
jgi:hypothetical protein